MFSSTEKLTLALLGLF